MDPLDAEIAKTQEERRKMEEVAMLTSVTYDADLYGGGPDRFEGYVRSIAVNDDEEDQDADGRDLARRMASYTGPKSLKEVPKGADAEEDSGFRKPQRIVDREDDYRRRRLQRIISPERHDPFASGEATPDPSVRTYADVMREQALERQKEEMLKQIAKKKEEEKSKTSGSAADEAPAVQKRRNRWDQAQDADGGAASKKAKSSDWDAPDSTPGIGRWDATPTPGRVADATPSMRRNRWDETPTPGRLADADATPAASGATPGATPAGMAWDATPKLSGLATPTPKRQRSRWDETPASMGSATPGAATPNVACTASLLLALLTLLLLHLVLSIIMLR